MGGRIGLEREMMSTIDHIEDVVAAAFHGETALNGGGGNGDGGASWPLPHAVGGMLGLILDLRPGPEWC